MKINNQIDTQTIFIFAPSRLCEPYVVMFSPEVGKLPAVALRLDNLNDHVPWTCVQGYKLTCLWHWEPID